MVQIELYGNAKLYYRGEQPAIEEESEEGEEREKGNDSESPEPSSSGDDADADDVAEDGCDCPTDEDGEPVHVEGCPEYVEQDNAAMEDMYDAETEDRINEMLQTGRFTHAEIADELDVAIDRVEEIHHEQHREDADEGADDEELLDDIGPCNIGKIMVQGTFQRYECNECGASFTDEGRADDHADEENHPTFKAYNQRPEKAKQPAGFVGGGTVR